MMYYAGIAFGIWNLVVWLIYGTDKLLAKHHQRRISEGVLLTLAFCMGAVGAMFGMVVFNHKTAKPKFRFLVPLYVLLNGALAWVVLFGILF